MGEQKKIKKRGKRQRGGRPRKNPKGRAEEGYRLQKVREIRLFRPSLLYGGARNEGKGIREVSR